MHTLTTLFSDSRYGLVSALVVVLTSIPAFVSLKGTGNQRLRWMIVVLACLAWGVEALSITTGIPYGKFTYGVGVGYALGGLVPWSVPFAWIPIIIGATAVAWRITRQAWLRLLIATLLAVAFDLVLDPVAVALGMWTWAEPGWYYNVPWSNFVGWVCTGFIGNLVLQWGLNRAPSRLALYVFLVSTLVWGGLAAAFMQGITVVIALVLSVVVFLVLRNDVLRYPRNDSTPS